jgi:hypothetical protein
MSDLNRTAALLGLAASLAVANTAAAIEAAAPAPSPSVTAEPTIKAAALATDGVAAKPANDPSCPTIAIASGADTFPRRDDDYQATLQALARDCANLGAETILKVGLVGEGSRDSAKGPSWFNAPLKLSVKNADGKVVETRKIRLRVTLPSGEQKTAFSHLEENVSLPPTDRGYGGWSVAVGFDETAAAAAPAKRVKRSARPAAARQAVQAARSVPKPAAPPAPPQQPNLDSPWDKVANAFTERRLRQREAERAAKIAEARARAERPRTSAAAAPVRRPVAAPQARAPAIPAQPANIRTADRR